MFADVFRKLMLCSQFWWFLFLKRQFLGRQVWYNLRYSVFFYCVLKGWLSAELSPTFPRTTQFGREMNCLSVFLFLSPSPPPAPPPPNKSIRAWGLIVVFSLHTQGVFIIPSCGQWFLQNMRVTSTNRHSEGSSVTLLSSPLDCAGSLWLHRLQPNAVRHAEGAVPCGYWGRRWGLLISAEY